MSGLNKLASWIKSQTDRAVRFKQRRPRRASVVFGAVGLLLVLLVSFLIAAVMFDSKTALAPVVAQITITKDGFIPAALSVEKGTKIVWTNTDSVQHQIQANPHPTGDSLPGLKSKVLNSNQTYEYTADTTGSFNYHDHLNPTANGTLEVRE